MVDGYFDGKYIGMLRENETGKLYGPFASYEDLKDFRTDNNIVGAEVWPEVPVAKTYIGAVWQIHTASGSHYTVTVTKNGKNVGRTKAEMVFPLKAVLEDALFAEPDSYIRP